MSIRALLEGEMRQRGWNQSALSRHLGVKQQLVSRWMDPDGRMRPSWESCVLIGERLGVPVADVQRLAGYSVPAQMGGSSDPEWEMMQRELKEIFDSYDRSHWADLRAFIKAGLSLSPPSPKDSAGTIPQSAAPGPDFGDSAEVDAPKPANFWDTNLLVTGRR